jgi:protein-S-isoprenylcysteine O-methyltransferase Ste14
MRRRRRRFRAAAWQDPPMRRPFYLVAGVAGHLLAVLPMVWFVGFAGGFAVPKTVDSGAAGAPAAALAVDLALIAAFGLVHSVLARPAVKARLARFVPAALERSLFSAIAGLQMIALMALWRPLPELVWSVGSAPARAALWTVYAAAWALVLWALAAIGSRHLFGLARAAAAAAGRDYAPPPFTSPGPYRHLRHPLYTATIVALFAAPEMSQGRLLLAAAFTLYIAVGVRFEERDLEREHGEAFRAYRDAVPGFLPSPARRATR